MLTWIELNKQNLLYNIQQFKNIAPQSAIWPVVKSNAYGHGVKEVVEILDQDKNTTGFMVVNLSEALELANYTDKNILVLSYFGRAEESLKLAADKKISLPVCSLECVDYLDSLNKKFLVNIKIDTGTTRLGFAAEESEEIIKYIQNKNVVYKEGGYKDITGYKSMEPHQRAILKRLFIQREKLAKKVDRPVHFILATKKIVSFAIKPPKNLLEWRKMRQVHPVVRNYAKIFFDEVQKGKKESIKIIIPKKKHYTPAQKEKLKQLADLREKIGTKLHLPKHLILSKEQMHHITIDGNLDSLRSWQKKLVEN